jgi:hypothetical protein
VSEPPSPNYREVARRQAWVFSGPQPDVEEPFQIASEFELCALGTPLLNMRLVGHHSPVPGFYL